MRDANQEGSRGRLPATFRRTEVGAVMRCVRAGDSCTLVATSGMGKSNLFRHLCDPSTRRRHLGESWQDYVFICADCHALGEMSERALYELLLTRLSEHAEGSGDGALASRLRPPDSAQPGSEALAAQRSFVQAVRAVMGSNDALNLVFLLDQFDDVYGSLNPRLFTVLRSVRDEHKYRVSYVTLTREELPYLRTGPECEEFYELFSANVLGLGPYAREDALALLARVAGRYGSELGADEGERLISLTDAHPGLLKAAAMALLKEGASLPAGADEAAEALLDVPDVANECAKLWGGISTEEREALRGLAGARGQEPGAEVGRRLRLKQLVREGEGGSRVFAPLFAEYVSRQKPGHVAETRVHIGPIRIDAAGEVWVNGQLLSPALPKKELLLLEYLCLEPGTLRTRDEIVAVVYPDEYRSGLMVSEDAVNALVKRLRSRLSATPRGRDYVVTVRGKGYRLAL